MKALFPLAILAILTGFCLTVNAQKQDPADTLFKDIVMPVDASSNLIVYTRVMATEGSKDDLFRKGLQWFNTYYKNPTGVIKEQNQADGKIMGKHQIKIMNPKDKKGVETMRGIVHYTIAVYFKDGKVKYEINDIYLKEATKFPIEKWMDKKSQTYTPKYNYFLRQVDDYMKTTIASLESAMNAKAQNTSTDW